MSNIDSPSSTSLSPPVYQHAFSKSKRFLIMSIVIYLGIANAFGALGATILLGPVIQKDLDITTDELQWLTTSFYITIGSLSLLSGRLADLVGGKRISLIGMAIFTLASLGACFVTTKEGLFATRGLSGLGSALAVVAGYPIIMMVTSPGNGRTLLLACFIAAWPTGVGLGTLAAGFIADDNWQKFFYLLTGITGLSFLSILIFVPDDRPDRLILKNQIDWLGNAFFFISLFFILYVLSVAPGSKEGWATPYIIVLLILGIAFIVAFALWEIRVERLGKTPPLACMSIFTMEKGRVSLLFLFGMFNFAGFSGFMFFTTLYFQEYLQLSLTDTAVQSRKVPFPQPTSRRPTQLATSPLPSSGTICNITVGLIAPYVPSQYILSFGSFATALSLILFAIMPVGASYWGYTFVAMICSVMGADCAGSAGIIYVTRVITESRTGMGTGLWQTMIQLGFCLGPSIGTLVLRYTAQNDAKRRYSSTLPYDDDGFPRESYLHGLRMGAWTIASLCLVGVVFPIVLRGMGNSKKERETLSDSIESVGMEDEENQKEVVKDKNLVIEGLTKDNEKLDRVDALEKK